MASFGPVYMMDFEGSARSGVVEYGIAELIDDRIERTWTRICAPTGPVGGRERATHQLRDAQMEDAVRFAEDWELFSSLRRVGPFGAHSASVEDGLLQGTWATPGRVPAFDKNPPATSLGWGPWLDTLKVARCCFPGFEKHDLASLVSKFELEADLAREADVHCPAERRRFHCALFDAIAAALVLLRIRRFEGWENVPVDWFIRCGSQQADTQGELPL